MQPKLTALLLTSLALAVAASAQPAQPAPPPPSAGFVNDFLRDQNPAFTDWDIGGQLRGRFEARSGFAVPGAGTNAVDFSRLTPDNNYWLSREKLHLGWKPVSWISAFAEARDSQSWEDKRRPELEEDSIDLNQAFLGLGNAKEFPLTAKIGRQELSYGDERLIGSFDWNNIGRVFDAAKLRFENDTFWVDVFSGRVVIPRDGAFNTVNDYDWFSGVYASTRTLIPKQETQLYFLSRNVGAQSPAAFPPSPPPLVAPASRRDIYTLGLRVKSTPGQFRGFDYEAELAGQLGNFYDSAQAKRLDQEALAAHVAGGYTFEKTSWKPRLGLEYNFSSGDRDPADGTHQTFDNLFPTNHRFYGFMDLISWQNIHNLRFATSTRPFKGFALTADYHLFWLADTSDFFYNAAGAPRRTGGYGLQPANDSFAGSELDLIATYQWKNLAIAQLGYAHFFRGEYVKQSLSAAGSQDADWFYAQITLNF